MISRFSTHDKDLTEGSIPRNILLLAIPTMAASMVQTAYHLVDAVFVGRLGSVELAAVGMGGHVIFPMFAVLMGVGTASTALVARAIGERNPERADTVAGQSILLALVLSVIVAVVGVAYTPVFLRLMGADAAVLEAGTAYLSVMLIGTVFMFPVFVGTGILRGAGDAMTPLAVSAIGALVNIPLDYVLIFGPLGLPAMGIRGAALASVISQGLVFAIGAYVILFGRTRIRLRFAHFRPDLALLGAIVRIGIPGSVQMSLRALMGTVLIGIVSAFGTPVVAAYTVVMRLHEIGFMPTFGIAMASATLVGQNLGASKADRAHRSAVTSMAFSIIVMGAAAVGFSLFAPGLISLFNSEPQVVMVGAEQLRIMSLGLVFSAIGIVLSRAISGAGETFVPMVITLLCLWGLQVPLARYLASFPEFGEHGVYWANVISATVQAALIVGYFYAGRWKSKVVWKEEVPDEAAVACECVPSEIEGQPD